MTVQPSTDATPTSGETTESPLATRVVYDVPSVAEVLANLANLAADDDSYIDTLATVECAPFTASIERHVYIDEGRPEIHVDIVIDGIDDAGIARFLLVSADDLPAWLALNAAIMCLLAASNAIVSVRDTSAYVLPPS